MVTFNSNILGLGLTRQTQQQSSQLSRIYEQLASGRRITNFAEDPAGGAIAARLESAFRSLGAMITGDQTQINRLQTEEAGLGGVTEELQRVRELQTQAQNAALAPEDVQALQDEINQRLENIQGLVENAQFAGAPVIEAGPELAALLENGVEAAGATAPVDAALEEVLAERGEIGAEVNAVQSRIAEREAILENTGVGFSQLSDLNMAIGVTEQVNAQLMQLLSIESLRTLYTFNRQNAVALLGAL